MSIFLNNLAQVIRALLLLVCLTPLVVSPTTVYPFVVGKAVYSRALIEVALALWLLLILYAPEYRPRRSYVLAALFAWLAVSGLAAMVGIDPLRSVWSTFARMGGLVGLAHWCAYSLMLASMMHTPGDWRKLVIVVVAVSGVVATLGLARYFLGWGPPEFVYNGRLGSTLGNGFFLGPFACLNICLAFALLMVTQRRWMVAVLSLVILLNVTALWLSASRGGLGALLIMAAILAIGLFLIDRRAQARRAALAVCGVVAVASVCVLLVAFGAFPNTPASESRMVERLEGVATPEGPESPTGNVVARQRAAIVALDAYRERPWVGAGPENFILLWETLAPAEWKTVKPFDNAHNKLLEVAATTGTLGLLAFLAFGALLVVEAVRAVRRNTGDEQRFALAMGTAVAGYFVMSMIMVDETALSFVFALLVGYVGWEEFRRRPAGGAARLTPKPWVIAPATLLLAPALCYALWGHVMSTYLAAGLYRLNIVGGA